jgi:hypothetical protein
MVGQKPWDLLPAPHSYLCDHSQILNTSTLKLSSKGQGSHFLLLIPNAQHRARHLESSCSISIC